MLNQRVAGDGEGRVAGGGVHGREATIFAQMKEYQAVMLRLSRRVHDDEDTLTDLLNERSRGGWQPALLSQEGQRLTIVFQRDSTTEA